MTKGIAFIILLFALSVSGAAAQVSAFASASYGYYTNPLYNYQKLSDQVKQSYLQLTYQTAIGSSPLNLSYINGIALFNHFEDRNYLEHSLNGSYALRWGGDKPVDLHLVKGNDDGDSDDSTSSDSETSTDEMMAQTDGEEASADEQYGEEQSVDSTGSYLGVAFKVSNRLDKEAHKEFDNTNGDLLSSFRFGESIVVRLGNTFGYRAYANLSELSNLSDMLNIQVRNKTSEPLGFGVNVGGGGKHFVTASIDTSKFETVRSFINKPPGRGKPGGKIVSKKLLLANPGSQTSYQVVTGAFIEKKWSATSLVYDFLVRINSKTTSRYLAQSSTASGLNDDIYNDQFSYAGWETKLNLTQKLFAGVEGSLLMEFQRKKFGAGAYTLSGDLTSDHRLDRRTTAELTLARSFDLAEGFQLEVLILAGVLRNQSNDEYSDFSARHIAFGLGIGF
jgi:hypothetical protein